MKVPKELRAFCPRCKRHEVHSVSIYKRGRERALAAGARRYERKQRGYGGQKKPIQRRLFKAAKKQVLKLTCKACGHIQHKPGIRLRKMEIKA